MRNANLSWIRSNGFLLGLAAAVLMGFILPQPGAQGGFLHADLVNNFGIALILFLQGLSLALEKIKSGAGNWRLHFIIQTFTFGIFPLVGIACHHLVPMIWTAEPAPIRDGFLYLCVLPSTVSTSVVLTAVARGNTPGALFNAALSNILGVFLTPLFVHFLMQQSGQTAPFLPLLLKILLLTLLPFFGGMLLRKHVLPWIEAHRLWIPRISNGVILFIVYSAFCDSVQQQIWSRHGHSMTILVLFFVALLFAGMSILIHLSCRVLRLNREDRIAAYFCSVKKTLAMGVPLALLIFGNRTDISLILLPIMFYHPLQLLINGILANVWAKQIQAAER